MILRRILIILILVFHVNISHSSHFQGGTITYKIVDTFGSTASVMITQTYLYKWPVVDCDDARILSQSTPNTTTYPEYNYTLNCVSNCTTTGGYQAVPVRTYCTDYSSAMAISGTQRTDTVNLTIGAYFTVAFASRAWRTLTLPAPGSSGYNWSIACTIDLRVRPDTGKLNTPPVATMISPVYIPVATRTALVVPTIDSDNDKVRCRFANSTTECSNVCPPNSLPNNTVLISSNCTLFITGAHTGDWYAAALQVEDFVDSTSTTPLSSVPVQFLINVYALPNCTTAPLLYGPSNQSGSCQSLQTGQAYTITLYAVNYCSSYGVTIQDIATLSFPVVMKTNLTKNTSTLYSVSLTWTPTANQVGLQILCAVAIDSQGVQSNQYCMAFAVSANSTGVCPTDKEETTTSLATTADDTTMMTTVTTTSTTTTQVSSSDTWSWILPLVAVLASLLPPICCLCICCPPPYGYGLLRRKSEDDKSSKPIADPDGIRRPPRMYMIYRAVGKNYDNADRSDSRLGSSRSTVSTDNNPDRFPIALRNSLNRREKNVVWVYPSSPSSGNVAGGDSSLSSSRTTNPSDTHLESFPLTVRNRANTNKKSLVWVQPVSQLENVSRHGSLVQSARSATDSDINLDLPSSAPRNSANKKQKSLA